MCDIKYPNLDHVKRLAVDIETYDPELTTHGPGVYRKDGKILGVSISDGQFSEYYNIGHKDCLKSERDKNIEYLKYVLSLPCEKVGAKFIYDLDWLCNGYGFVINGKLHDVQIAEPLLDENKRDYDLDSLSSLYLGYPKYKDKINQFCENNNLKGDSRKHLYLMPYELVREYGKIDAKNTLLVFEKQLKKLEEEDLLYLYEIESGLLRTLLQMRKTGVRVDVNKLEKSIIYIEQQIRILTKHFNHSYGQVNINSSKQLRTLYDSLQIPYNVTDKGNPSFDAKFLDRSEHEVSKKILEIRKLKTGLAFFKNSFLSNVVGDRIHCSFNSVKNETAGTIARFSSSNPNLQQVTKPNDDAEDYEHDIGAMARSIFIPEQGCLFGSFDYSQIEYRFFAHYAMGPAGDKIREEYNSNPETDYHAYIMGLTGFKRKLAKNLNFGAGYLMGINTCMNYFNWTREEATNFLNHYHANVPFIKYTASKVVEVAKLRDIQTRGHGYIQTILKRKRRISDEMRGKKFESNEVVRDQIYKVWNGLIQGSAADTMKKAMHDAYNKGLFNVLKLHLTIHDELDFSFDQTNSGIEACRELKATMENAVKLKVPIIVKPECGPDWGHLKKMDI